LATAGAAHAQEVGQTAGGTDLPWYQRFTSSTDLAEPHAEAERLQPSWTLSQRWGVTVDVREAQRITSATESRRDETAVGAYYQFTPRVRLGGELSLQTQRSDVAPTRQDEAQEPAAGVRIQSAFRF
jgi:hypothetical protein